MASTNKRSAIQRREEMIDQTEHMTQHMPKTGPSNSLKIKLDHLQTLQPLTENQSKFFEAYKRGDYFIGCFGSAGTGKTTLPMYRAIEEVLDKNNPFKQVVVIRTSVQSGREIGFLPGSLDEKMEVFELPYKEICQMLFNRPDAWDRLKEQGYARFITTVALRGISLDDSIIIFDEMQNANWSDVNTVMTRIGNRSKVIFCGDFRQNDLIHSRTDVTAFDDFLKVARRMKSFTEIYYTPDDIVRSNLTKDWIVTCESVNLK
jgi:predicted ribonuclease YlaK